MKISNKRIREIIREELNEITTGAMAYKPVTRARTKQKKTSWGSAESDQETHSDRETRQDRRTDYKYKNTADQDVKGSIVHGKNTNQGYAVIDTAITTHATKQPAKNVTTTTPDTTKWTHPYSKVTTTLKKGTKQPDSGWAYTQQDSDMSQWTHPASGKTAPLKKGQTKPELGWSATGKDKKTGKKTTRFGFGDQARYDFEKGHDVKQGWETSSPKKTTNPYFPISKKTPGKMAFGSGNKAQYDTAVKGAGTVGQTGYTKVGQTTNPSTTSTQSNPNWTTWDNARQKLGKIKTMAKANPTKAHKYTPVDYKSDEYGASGGTSAEAPINTSDSDEYETWKRTRDEYEADTDTQQQDFNKFQKQDRAKVAAVGANAATKAYGTKAKGKGKEKGEEDDEYKSVKKESVLKDIRKLTSESTKIHRELKKNFNQEIKNG